MRPISEATARITSESFSRKYIALGRIVKSWPEIVGEKLAIKAQPAKLRYRRKGNGSDKREKPDCILDVAVSSADATLLHYQKDLILERINQIFGEQWINDIRFVNITGNNSGALRKKPKAPLTAAEKTTLSELVETIDDPDIKKRLLTLGQEIIKDSKG